MGTDLTVREQVDFRTDSKGRMCYTVVELFNFRPFAHVILDHLGIEMTNCSTVAVDAMDFKNCLQSMKDTLSFVEHDGESRLNQDHELERAIEYLEDFIEDNDLNEVEDYGERTFEVHLWY